MSLRNLLSVSKDFTQLVLMLMFIILAALAIIWFGFSVWANVFEKPSGQLPDMPSIDKAHYIGVCQTTGEVLLTPSYDVTASPENPELKLYTLHGVFKVVNGKWKYTAEDFPIDEYYWGKFIINQRR